MFINPNAGSVTGGDRSIQQNPASGTPAQALPQPGKGGLQGTMVSVGEGSTAALREDAAQAQGRFGGVFSAFWQAAEMFTFALHGDLLDDDAEVRSEVDRDATVRTDTHDNDTLSEVDDETSSGVDDGTLSEVDDETLSEVDDDDDEFFDCDDDGVAAFNARLLERQALPDGPIGSPPLTLDDVEILPLSALLDVAGEPDLHGESASPAVRETVAQQTQQQQDGIFSRLITYGGNVLKAAASATTEAISSVASAAFSHLTGAVAPVAGSGSVADGQKTVSERNLARAGEVVGEIDNEMAKLNETLRLMGGDELRVPNGERLNVPTLSTWDTLSRWNHQARGALSAGLTTLGWSTAAVAIPTAASVITSPIGWTPTGIGINATAVLGGAYLGLSALRDFPELATREGALNAVKGAMEKVAPLFRELDNLIAQERSRQTAGERTMLVSLERAPRMDALQRELAQVGEALKAAPSDATQGSASHHTLALGDGQARTQTLDLAAPARSAFQSFFGSIARGLSSVGRFLADLPNVPGRLLERRAAGKSELAYTQGPGSNALNQLASPRAGGIVHLGLVDQVRGGAPATGDATREETEMLRQMRIGENLTHALRALDKPAFGAIAVGEGSQQVAITANLTTARAMAWYFDGAARDGKGQEPTVTRNADGSLSVADPDRKLYSFLMHAPSVYTGAMIGGTGGEPGRLTLDDHRRGFPNGARGMQFETSLNAQGGTELRVRFIAGQARPVFNPLANEHKLLLSMYRALRNPAPVGERQADFSGWSREKLEAHRDSLLASLQREAGLMAGDQQQIRDLQDWQNPAFLAGRG